MRVRNQNIHVKTYEFREPITRLDQWGGQSAFAVAAGIPCGGAGQRWDLFRAQWSVKFPAKDRSSVETATSLACWWNEGAVGAFAPWRVYTGGDHGADG